MEREVLSSPKSCALCGNASGLKESHIIPRFAFKYLKSTSGSGFLRDGERPKVRTQDGFKTELLCELCELEFSKYEGWFHNNVFHQILSGQPFDISYEESFIRFCTSISWRVLKYLLREDPTYLKSDDIPLAQRAETELKKFLLKASSNPGQYEQHFFPLPAIESVSDENIPRNINRYFLRTVQIDLLSGDDDLLVFSKLPGMLILGIIKVKNRKVLLNSKIRMSGFLRPTELYLPDGLSNYMFEKCKRLAEIHRSLPPAQKEKLRGLYKMDPERIMNSGSIKAFEADFRIFGASIFEPEDDGDGSAVH